MVIPVLPDFDRDGWPTLAGLAAEIPAATARLVLDPPSWIHRRVETIEFLGENRVGRHVSLDFTLPNLPALYRSDGVNTVAYVPLTLLKKAVLERFDLRDEEGNALSLLTRPHNRLISRRMLVGAARAAIFEGLNVDLDPGLADNLRKIVEDAEPEALEGLEALKADADQDEPNDQVKLIWSTWETTALLQDLSTAFVLYVPLVTRPGQRRVIKYSHEQEFRREHRPQTAQEEARLPAGEGEAMTWAERIDDRLLAWQEHVGQLVGSSWARLKREFRREPRPQTAHEEPRLPAGEGEAKTWAERIDDRFLARQEQVGHRVGSWWVRVKRELLLEPWRFGFGLSLGGASNTHIEVPAPEDLLVARAEIVATNQPGSPCLAGPVTATELAHLQVGPQPRETAAVLYVDFVLRASGVLSTTTLIAVFTTLMLTAGVILHFAAGVPVRADPAGAVVVVAPAIFAPFLAVSARHQLVRRVVRMLRGLLMSAALISFAAAASLVASFPHHVRAWIWVGLLGLSLFPTILLTLAWRNAHRIERRGELD